MDHRYSSRDAHLQLRGLGNTKKCHSLWLRKKSRPRLLMKRREFFTLLGGAAWTELRWKSLSCLRLLALLDSVVTQKGMNAAYPIDHLGYAQVHD